MIQRRKDNKNRVLKEGEYQRSNGLYEYKWHDNLGKRHSAYASTLKELREKEEQIEKKLEEEPKKADGETLDELFERWVKIKRGLKESTFNKYVHDYNRYIRPSLGSKPVTQIKTSNIRAFYSELADTLHFTVVTIATIHRILHQILEMAVNDDILAKNPSKMALFLSYKKGAVVRLGVFCCRIKGKSCRTEG